MLHLYENKKAKRAVAVAALLTFASAGVAVARQDAPFPGLPPANGNTADVTNGSGSSITNNTQGLQSLLQRASQFQRAASIRGNTGPSAVRVSYGAANQAFGDLLRTIGTSSPPGDMGATSDRVLNVTSEQAAGDVRLLRSAARQAKSADEENRLKKAASLYATGAKEFLTAQLREALLETDVAPPVVVRGNAQQADAATRALNQPPPAPAPAPRQPDPNPAPNPNPNPVPNPAPAPIPAPAPDPNPAPMPAPNPQPLPPDPTNPAPLPPVPNQPAPPVPPRG